MEANNVTNFTVFYAPDEQCLFYNSTNSCQFLDCESRMEKCSDHLLCISNSFYSVIEFTVHSWDLVYEKIKHVIENRQIPDSAIGHIFC